MKQSTRSHTWTRAKPVGRGSFGAVDVALRNSDGQVFTVKSVDKGSCLPSQLASLENEIRILRSLQDSPFVVRYLGDDVTNEGPRTSFRNLHLEYLPRGTAADLALADVDRESVLRLRTRSIVSALELVHSNGIVHCDVKGRNILVGDDFVSVKLADFGSAMELKKGSTGRCPIVPRGSPMWMAPEVIRREYQGPDSDVWSLGCTMIEMVTGKPAWEDRGLDSLTQIAYTEELPAFPTELSDVCQDFLEKCLRRYWRERWSCDQLLRHPFLATADTAALHWAAESSPRCVLDLGSSYFDGDEETEDFEVPGKGNLGNGRLVSSQRDV